MLKNLRLRTKENVTTPPKESYGMGLIKKPSMDHGRDQLKSISGDQKRRVIFPNLHDQTVSEEESLSARTSSKNGSSSNEKIKSNPKILLPWMKEIIDARRNDTSAPRAELVPQTSILRRSDSAPTPSTSEIAQRARQSDSLEPISENVPNAASLDRPNESDCIPSTDSVPSLVSDISNATCDEHTACEETSSSHLDKENELSEFKSTVKTISHIHSVNCMHSSRDPSQSDKGAMREKNQDGKEVSHSHSVNCIHSSLDPSQSNKGALRVKNQDGKEAIVSQTCKGVKFDPRVWIHEYEPTEHEANGENWFNESELKLFKREAVSLIQTRNIRLLGTGTGLILKNKSLFSHPALGMDSMDKHRENLKLQHLLTSEIRNILVVDSHEISLSLFTKSFKNLMPHVDVTTARTSLEALRYMEKARRIFCPLDGRPTHGFDIIIVEERLYLSTEIQEGRKNEEKLPVTGSELIQRITIEQKKAKDWMTFSFDGNQSDFHPRYSLLIGVSAHPDEDHPKLEKSGADLVWNKPPPSMNALLRNQILKAVIQKRKQGC